MHTFSTVLKTLLTLAVLGTVGGFAFIYSGIYDVSASTPDNAYVAWAIHVASDASVGARLAANKVPPGLDKPEMVNAGGRLFVQNCAVCHGAPGVAPTHIAQGLNPAPPDLFRATRKPDEQENFQFIHNGVKMTAMPAFGASEGEEHVWQLVAFLNKLPGISATDYATLTTGSAPAAK
jgi:mono/diheme cytochrome c family protein